MMEKRDLLWALYESEREHIRHHEEQRTAASNILAAIAAGLVVALGTEKLIPLVEIAIALCLVAMGYFGTTFCGKLSERIKLHVKRSHKYLTELDADIANVSIASLKKDVEAAQKAEFPKYYNRSLSRIWADFHRFIMVAGIAFFVFYVWNWVVSLQ